MLAILATDEQLGLAKSKPNSTPFIPWHSPEDLKIFAFMANEHTNWVSKSTFDSLPINVQLNPRRHYRFLTSSPQSSNEFNFEHLFKYPKVVDSNQNLLIGGQKAYENLIPICHAVVHSTIVGNYQCDYRLRPNLIYRFDHVMNVYHNYRAPNGQLKSVDIYFNQGEHIPQHLIGFIQSKIHRNF